MPGFLRVAGTVRFDSGDTQVLWFDVPADQEWAINDQGDPWAVLLLPEAMVRGEDLQIDLPVDKTLLDNLLGLQRLWTNWFDYVDLIDIKAPTGRLDMAGAETAQFFSGGIDSFHTLGRGYRRSEYPAVLPTSCLLTIWGFDVPLAHPDEFAAVWALGKETARRFDMDCVAIATNMRELKSTQLYLGPLTHGASIIASGLLLSRRFQNLVIASSFGVMDAVPWGSHVLVDPLFSTSQTRVIHDGGAFTRMEKTQAVAAMPEALSSLRVCWAQGAASNCSRCSKCIRTMSSLDLLGAKDGASSFDWSDYSLSTIAKTYIPSQRHAELLVEVRDAARARGRDGLARALNRSLLRSIPLRYVVVPLSQGVWLKIKNVSVLRRLAAPLYRFVTGRIMRR